jgi:putative inorganic carbon (HCO3(-)) transporter
MKKIHDSEYSFIPSEVSFLRKSIQIFVCVLYFLISISFYLGTYDSAQVKITLLQMGGLSAVCLWISLLILEGKKAFSVDDFVFLSPFISYLFYIFFSFVNVPYKEWALDDFLRYILYAFISLIIIREFDKDAIERLTKFLIASLWIVVVYGIIQWIDVNFFPPKNVGGASFDPFIWRGAFGNRIFSTYGNPNFFGNYLVLMLPVVGARFLKTRNILLLVLGVLDVFCIINTFTKGAWLGFSISFLIFVSLYLYYFTNISKKVLRIYYFVFMVIGLLVIIWVLNYAIKTSRTSVPFRVSTWLSTWEMIETHPLVGTGVGSFRPIYPAYRRPIIFHLEGKHNTETDHAENEHLEQFLDNGIIGAGIFYWIILFVSITALRAIRFNNERGKKEDSYLILGYLVSFLGMLIHNFTDVSMRFVSSGVYFGLLPAVIINLSRGHGLWEFHYVDLADRKVIEEKKRSFWKMVLSFVAIGILLWCGFKVIWEFSSLQMDFKNQQAGSIILGICAWIVMLSLILQVVYSFVRVLFKTYNPYVAFIVLIFYLPFRYFPVYHFWGWFKADIYHNIAIYFSKQGKWDTAISYYRKVVENNPIFIMPYYFMGNVFLDRFDMNKTYKPWEGDKYTRTDFERAYEMYEKVRSLAPNYVQMHHQMGVLYMKMADYLKSQGKIKEAVSYLDKALYRFNIYENLDPVFVYNYLRKAQVYVYKGEFKKAEEEYLHYLKAWKCHQHKFVTAQKVYGVDHEGNGIDPPLSWSDIYPNLPEVYTNLANLYFLMKDYKKAYEYYKKALDKKPDFEPAKRNIQILMPMLK